MGRSVTALTSENAVQTRHVVGVGITSHHLHAKGHVRTFLRRPPRHSGARRAQESASSSSVSSRVARSLTSGTQNGSASCRRHRRAPMERVRRAARALVRCLALNHLGRRDRRRNRRRRDGHRREAARVTAHRHGAGAGWARPTVASCHSTTRLTRRRGDAPPRITDARADARYYVHVVGRVPDAASCSSLRAMPLLSTTALRWQSTDARSFVDRGDAALLIQGSVHATSLRRRRMPPLPPLRRGVRIV